MDYKIRNINKSDLASIEQLRPKGWPDVVSYFDYYIKISFCFPICAIKDNQVIAVGNAIVLGESGWLSHIIVAKEFQRQGIGTHITQRLIDLLLDNKCTTVHLIASHEGEPLYKKLGFHIENYYLFFQGQKLNYSNFPDIVELTDEFSINNIIDLDKKITNEERWKFMEPFVNRIFACQNSNKKITGFYIPDFADGPILAEDPASGIQLLKFKHSHKDCKSIIPDSNQNAVNFFRENNFTEFNRVSRMYYGKKFDWQPWNVYSRAGGFIG